MTYLSTRTVRDLRASLILFSPEVGYFRGARRSMHNLFFVQKRRIEHLLLHPQRYRVVGLQGENKMVTPVTPVTPARFNRRWLWLIVPLAVILALAFAVLGNLLRQPHPDHPTDHQFRPPD